jgi:hypothetical protein
VPARIRQRLPLCHLVGTGRSTTGANWSADPLGRLRGEALALGVINRRDLEEAKR